MARELDVENHCIPEVGRLLRVLVAQAGSGNIGELGTGCGVGAAWMLSGLRPDQRFISVERDSRLHGEVSTFFGHEEACFVRGNWWEILDQDPFALLFIDVAEAKDSGIEEIVWSLSTSGIAVLDDFTPQERWPEAWHDKPDERREKWLCHSRLAATEILTTHDTAAILATRVC